MSSAKFNRQVQVVTMTSQMAQGDRLAKLLSDIRVFSLSNREAGAVEYRIARDQDHFVCFEIYADKAAIIAHTKTPAVVTLLQEIARGDLLVGKPEVKVMVEV